jgi:two-component system sensor histidine kinase QseC
VSSPRRPDDAAAPPATQWFPLRRNLLFSLLAGLALLWLATLATSYVDAHHEIDEIFDAQLAQAARQALEQFRDGGDREGERAADDSGDERDQHDDDEQERPRIAHPYQQKVALQIWDRDGHLLLRSAGAPDTPLAAVDGYSEDTARGRLWRYYGEWSGNHRLRVVVGQNHDVRGELIGKIAMRLAFPLLIGLPLSALWIAVALSRGMAPLAGVARDIGRRGPDQLEAVSPARAPEEIRPLVESLNGLLARLFRALEGERRFTADAAHELRTPLAGLRAQAQVALRADNEAQRRHALEQVLAGTGRAAHLIDQLLTLARLDPTRQPTTAASADIAAVAAEVCAELGSSAVARHVSLTLDVAPGQPPKVACAAEWLRILIRNLVDNALRYSEDGGTVRVEVGADPAAVTLSVTDDGPGIPAELRTAVFERFRRLAGQHIEGSGLGLSIVARIVEMAGAAIELGDGSGGRGLCVRVRFPAPASV